MIARQLLNNHSEFNLNLIEPAIDVATMILFDFDFNELLLMLSIVDFIVVEWFFMDWWRCLGRLQFYECQQL